MKKALLAASLVLSAFALSGAVEAQGLPGGIRRGAAEGDRVAGPIGGIVGGAVGAATGTVGGILGVDMQPRFRSYVRERNVRSYDYDGRVAVGSTLPTQRRPVRRRSRPRGFRPGRILSRRDDRRSHHPRRQ